MAYTVTIGGAAKDIQPGWSITAQLNGRDQFQFSMLSVDGTYRPALDAEVVLANGATTVFGGFIVKTSEAGLGGHGVTPILTTVTAESFDQYADRRYAWLTVAAGNLKAALTAYIAGAWIDAAVALDAAQVDGPALPALTYSETKGSDLLNDLMTQSGGYVWRIDADKKLKMFLPSTEAAPFNITVPNCKAIGDVTVEPTRLNYANRVVIHTENGALWAAAVAAGEVAAHGYWEAVYTAPDETSQTALQAMADMILARSTPTTKTVKYYTQTDGLAPGQSQTITLATRNVNNSFLITEVVTRDVGPATLGYDVTAIEGAAYQTGWRETWKKAFGGSAVGVVSGGGGGAPVTRMIYPLATGVDSVQSPTPTWVPATGGSTDLGKGRIQVQIDTVARGTTAATVKARLRALDAGVSVQARLYDVTDSVACAGVSSVETSVDGVNVTFAVTLTAGNHWYELQLLPGTANKDVNASAYVE
jgi:hypothetical protein